MRNTRIHQLTRLALPWLMCCAFLLPSFSAFLGTQSTHQLTLEVCTDHGLQLVQAFDAQTKDQTSSKSSDHCPLCQLQGVSVLLANTTTLDLPSFFSLPPVTHVERTQRSRLAWTHLPARAPPILT